MLQPFHLAIPVDDLAQSRQFYGQVMGCAEGRSSTQWIDWNFFGHQLVTHVAAKADAHFNGVDGKAVPVPHFGVVLGWDDWHALADRLSQAGCEFVIEPGIRFEGLPGEQATFFLYDPALNALEFKAFKDMDQLFAT